ncbi:MAG: class I adenylate-forming enzyme family protein [Myxococcales bacterium]|nr:class I adenylate-forming enzyme family protein [Myxococcales bacterium]
MFERHRSLPLRDRGDTALSLPRRALLFADPTLGCGNFLERARSLNRHRGNDFMFLERPFISCTGEHHESFSLDSLSRAVDDLAGYYHGAGVRMGDPIAIYVQDGIANFVHVLALNNLGAIAVPINGKMPPAIAAGYIRHVGVTGVFCDAHHHASLRPELGDHHGLRFVEGGACQGAGTDRPPHYPVESAPRDAVMVCHSSGTTGIPKAVTFEHRQFFIGKRIRLLNFPCNEGELMLTAMPSSHSAGYSYFMTATLLGLKCFVLSDYSGASAAKQIRRLQPTIVAAFPQTHSEVATDSIDPEDFRSVKMWINTGDAAHETHIRVLTRLGPEGKGSRFIDGFGASELGMALFNKVSRPDTARYGRYMGKPRRFAKAAVIDEFGDPLPPGVVGLLGIRSPTITPGYWNESARTYRSFRRGYWTTGDLAYRDERGHFYHVDRAPDAIGRTADRVCSLPVEESILKHQPEVADCTVIGSPDRSGRQKLVALVKLRQHAAVKAQSLLVEINRTLSERGDEQLSLLSLVDSFPVGPTGKVLKRQLREEYRDVLTAAAASEPPVGAYDVAQTNA